MEISGIRNAVLVLSCNEDQNNKGKTWYYRNADRPGDTDSVKQNVYSSGSTQQELNLKEGFSKVLAADYNNYYGIDVREGEHTVVLDGLAIVRDHTFLTVRSGATLNLKLTGKSYLKSGSAILEFLALAGAHQSALAMENARVIKSVRNDVNRQTNAEIANQAKTSRAAIDQIRAIRQVVEAHGMENLPPALQDFIKLRVRHPEATLKELGELANPPLSKSAVYHRVRRIEQLASELDNQNR